MRTVWAVGSGEFSDRQIHCLFTSVDLAMEYLLRQQPEWTPDNIDRWGSYWLDQLQLWDNVPHADAEAATKPTSPEGWNEFWADERRSISEAYESVKARLSADVSAGPLPVR